MRSAGGVKMNWPLVAIACAVIAVPLGIALVQDLGGDRKDPFEELAALEDDLESEEPYAAPGETLDDLDELGEWKAPAMDQAFYDEVLLGGPEQRGPALRGPLAAVRWGMTRAELALEAPILRPEAVGEDPRVTYRAAWSGEEDGRLEGVVITFADDGTARRLLTDRWGEPRIMIGAEGTQHLAWFQGRLRVILVEMEGSALLFYQPYLPVGELVGADGLFAFETRPILGTSLRSLVMEYGPALHVDEDGARLDCPLVESAARPTVCTIRFEDDVARELRVIIDHSSDSMAGAEIFTSLRERLGDVKSQSTTDAGNLWTFARGFSIVQQPGTNQIEIRRTR